MEFWGKSFQLQSKRNSMRRLLQFPLQKIVRQFQSSTALCKRTIAKNPSPLPFPVPPKEKSSTKPFVQFNLTKIRRLSGPEKIDLLRDYYKTKAIDESIFVYKIIEHNGYLDKLTYNDHHCVFRLLLKDPVKYRDEIKLVYASLRVLEYSPTENFMNDYCIASTKWGNLEQTIEFLEEIERQGLNVRIDTWSHVLKMALAGNESDWQRGILVWRKLQSKVPLIRPSKRIYLTALELYTKLNDSEQVLAVFVEAEENLERLVKDHCERIGVDQDLTWKKNTWTMFVCKVLAIFSKTDNFHAAIEFYNEYYKLGIFHDSRTVKSAMNVYHIMFGLLSQMHKLNIKEIEMKEYIGQGSEMVTVSIQNLGKVFLKELQDINLIPDSLIFSRLLSIQEDEESCINLYLKSSPKTQSLDNVFVGTMIRLQSGKVFDFIPDIETRHRLKPELYQELEKLCLIRAAGLIH
jgi:tetratricopeptide (TPR) repeat protein